MRPSKTSDRAIALGIDATILKQAIEELKKQR